MADPTLKRAPGVLDAWLNLLRVSNLPTVWSNVLVGCAIGLFHVRPGDWPWNKVALVLASVSLLYWAGMALNDVMDLKTDRVQRPGRPLPSGRIRPFAAGVFVLLAFIMGAALAGNASTRAVWPVAILAGAIYLYDRLHRHGAWTVALLGLCRALVYVLAATVVTSAPPIAWLVSACVIVAVYIIALSIVARAEAGQPARQRLVLMLLRGISLLDAVLLLLLGQPLLAAAAVGCFVLTWIAHKRIMGT